MPPKVFATEAEAAREREWERFGEAPVTTEPLTDEPPQPLTRLEIIRRVWVLEILLRLARV